eukprot:1471178-Amphidinium_carterae.1
MDVTVVSDAQRLSAFCVRLDGLSQHQLPFSWGSWCKVFASPRILVLDISCRDPFFVAWVTIDSFSLSQTMLVYSGPWLGESPFLVLHCKILQCFKLCHFSSNKLFNGILVRPAMLASAVE